MSERKPAGVTFESWIDQQVRQAAEQGAFDHLPGAGRPLPDVDRADEAWWLKRKLREEGLSLPLPPGLQLRKDVAQALPAIRALPAETEVRAALAELNQRIRKVNATLAEGPSSDVAPIDVEGFLAGWRAARDTVAR